MIASTSWRKSSYSGPQNNCVELTTGSAGARIRDSKNKSDEALSFDLASFGGFLASVKAGALKRLT
jgi:hypothetical protein